LSDARLLALCFFFCLWQVPHFWLLVPEYGPELERAGIRSLTAVMGPGRVRRLICVWMSLSASSCLLLPLFGSIGSASACFLLAGAACWLTWKSARLLLAECAPDAFREAFADINAFALLVMGLLAADRYLAGTYYFIPF
jgi:protoheme IX farnesyltransferase